MLRRSLRVDRGRSVSLAPDYLRWLIRLEAMPQNASVSDESWVHEAHANAVRRFESARPR